MKRMAVVVGGGVSGLTAAYRFVQAGWNVHLIEARADLGGLARSMALGNGRIEHYYHFICGGDAHLLRMAEELGVREKVHFAPARVGHYYRGRLYPFSTALDVMRFSPLSLRDRVRLGRETLKAQKLTDWRPLDEITAKEWLLKTVGPRVYEVLWRPLLEIKFGPYYDRVSAAWLWHRMWRVGTSRKSALESDAMGYFEGGSETLLSALAERAQAGGARITTGVSALKTRRDVAGHWGVQTDKGDIDGDAVVMAVPLPVAADLVRDDLPAWSEALEAVPYLGVVCVLVRADGPLTRYFWVNVNDERIAANGFIEYSNLNPGQEAWEGDTLYVPMYLPADDPRFWWEKDQWARYLSEGLGVIDGAYPGRITAQVVTRDVFAQPVCTPGFAGRVPTMIGPKPGIFLVEASQLYPSDRCLSGMIGLAGLAVKRAEESKR